MAINHSHPSSVRNLLLAALPPDNLAQLLPKLDLVTLPHRVILYAAETPIDAVCFIESGMVSLVAGLEEGSRGEVGVVGREGMTGMPLVAGVDSSFTEAMVQMPATALRMGAEPFRQELQNNPALKVLLLRYGEAAQAQVAQTSMCNGRHALEQRLARWLLIAHDRIDGDELPLTQEFVAMMLNVRRSSVTVTAGILQKAGLIRYASGRITVLDRDALESASCECYAVVQRRYAYLMGKNQADVSGRTDSAAPSLVNHSQRKIPL